MELVVRQLEKVFSGNSSRRELTVFKDMNFQVSSGEFISIIGPSGCGKSTLLEIIAGLQGYTGGQITIDGVPLKQSRANCAIVFQQYGLFPWLTVVKNIEFGLKIRGIPRNERKKTARKFIEMVGLTGFDTYYPHELSGGMQQRVAIGRALANEPDILLLDEPFAALDAQTKENCQRELLAIWRETGVTTLFVTHDVSEAIFLSDRVLVLSKTPASIQEEMVIDLKRPRDFSLRLETGFRELEIKMRALISDHPN